MHDPAAGLGSDRLERALERAGLLDPESLRAAVTRAQEEDRCRVALLVDEEIVPEDLLADAVARALSTVVIDLELGALDRDAVALIPESVAARYLVIGVSSDGEGRRLRAAFADPFDEQALAAVHEHTGLQVDPLVGTVSGLRAAIETQYGTRSTKIIRAEQEALPPTPTSRVPAQAEVQSTDTSMLPRWPARIATIEQRHEALLLALIDRGLLTREDYTRALSRLLGEKEE